MGLRETLSAQKLEKHLRVAPAHRRVVFTLRRAITEMAPAIDDLLGRAAADPKLQPRAGDEIASTCELYSDGVTAQIEAVITLEQHRNKGLARAVVMAALDDALAEGHDLVFLVADDDDWPQRPMQIMRSPEDPTRPDGSAAPRTSAVQGCAHRRCSDPHWDGPGRP